MTAAPGDPVDLLARALAQAAAGVEAVREDQLGDPSPCRAWTVADLVDHLLDELPRFTARARGAAPERNTAARDRNTPASDRGAGDRSTAFRSGAAELVAAWRQAGDLTGTVELPGMGTVPARFPVDQQTAEFAVHAWDLARATGRSPGFDEEVGRSSLDWARTALRPEFRGGEASGKAFGPEVQAGPDAALYDRLAAFFGRDPARV
ncbi:TIGR03086 family metal-binding protein [Kitasatospora sp. NPDC048540]|uniref:TIGR03086 family metal-binding protein n=1 Tax=Kitasatospora sp. NPDC048540 TaxID=3155634 RepID=UPI0033C54A4E